MKRRRFTQNAGMFAAGASLLPLVSCMKKRENVAQDAKAEAPSLFFSISLAQWSLHKAIFAEEMSSLDFARVAREDFDVDGIEYVSAFLDDIGNSEYLDALNQKAKEYNIEQVLIMVDREGSLATPNEEERIQAVENHYKWVDAAKYLGCHSIRVNCFGEGSEEEMMDAAVDGLSRLSTYAAEQDINIIVENHGGLSSNATWLSGVMKKVSMPNCGTLPDFGNFCVAREGGDNWSGKCIDEYDRYKGVQELMPFAKGVSAKSYDFDEEGNETKIDFVKMLQIVKDEGYKGFVGIEYEGEEMPEKDGILATKKLLLEAAKKLV